ncbi:MAG: hypothetical protein QM658_09605 [Gordonia sp. (in: high G+C Gram-positive bacteria)]
MSSKAPLSDDDAWRERKKIDDVFGDELPESAESLREPHHIGRGREWYDENRPPHYE